MAKKRRAWAISSREASSPDLEVRESKKRIRDFEDVADSDDEFHINRDKILLDEEPSAKRRREWKEREEFLQPSDEEVLSYSEDEEDEDEEKGEDIAEDVLPRSGRHTVDWNDENSVVEGDVEEEELEWGTSKADLYGADAIETEEQALEEEAEALRLQKKQLRSTSGADFGFDDSEVPDATIATHVKGEKDVSHVTAVLPQLQVDDDMGPTERLSLLNSRYPEFEPLTQELLQLQTVHARLAADAKAATQNTASDQTPVVATQMRAASAYIGTLTIYFALLCSPAASGRDGVTAAPAIDLRDHPVMSSLVECRELWQQVKALPAESQHVEKENAVVEISGDHASKVGSIKSASALANKGNETMLKKTRAQRHAEAVQEAASDRKAIRMQRTEADLADLNALFEHSARQESSRPKLESANAAHRSPDDIGDELILTARELVEKAKRKKSLRFYTSQIAQKANKRSASGRNAGGDEDIPYRERLKDRQARLNAEAEKRGRQQADTGAELGDESNEEDGRQSKQIRAEAGDEDYYDLIAARTAKKKSDKVAFAEAQRLAIVQGGRVIEEATVGPDGKRKISYAIEKNKGLTPHRKKEVRNPRVKKRKKFEEKKKKLASMKPVYKGGEGRGGYKGELTGIKKGLVKSTKL